MTADGDTSGDNGIIVKYARLSAGVVTISATAIGFVLIFCGSIFHLSDRWSSAFGAVGESVIASVLIFVLFSLFLDPVRQRRQAQEIAGYAINVAYGRFQERFESSLPSEVFEYGDVPTRSFRAAFETLISASTRYDVKGGAAEFATFRLAMSIHKREFRDLEQIRLCILDPRADDCLRAHVGMRLRQGLTPPSEESVRDETVALRERVFVSLVALYDIRVSLATTVYLHRDLPFIRCEMFDGGMFLTYYLDRSEYSENLQFSSRTRPYRAYGASMRMTRRFARTVAFGAESSDSVDSEPELLALLAELGCHTSLAELRLARDERFRRFRGELAAGRIDPAEIF
ncbi:hypothetical protein [Actinacidiphila bryophytorum]|uniref:hypothetical protein n=1 Tax=Actinacidiphila bryophytorum TaxID=1436133 RepID=UPI002176A07F|nr:hypothetical protein [Actinacidiphila bryophytorum]UWE10020.1 hypothetical protein NYE86_15745 [Actinacidiphila bryophytorum]